MSATPEEPDKEREDDSLDPWQLHLTALNHAISADFRRALAAAVVACLGLALTWASGGVLGTQRSAPVSYFHNHSTAATLCAIGGAVIFFASGVVAVRSATTEILKIVPSKVGDDRKVGLRWICLVTGYLLVIFGTLGALNVPIGRLALGASITGVILGIAAQQSLNNFFAGLILLVVRPVSVGQKISIRSGPIGGPYTGEVVDMTLTYVRMDTARGELLLPNSTILTAVIGPPGAFDEQPPTPSPPAPAADPLLAAELSQRRD
ncbi:MAG TPA: mechanosensitive ion channel family protein [Actinospica sp.]|nr:mechanosensitive ion channel family protein [Actinospica sp.]